MRITFLLPGVGVCGGVRVVMECANEMVALGHEVFLVYPEFPGCSDSWWKHALRKRVYQSVGLPATDPSWFASTATLLPARHPLKAIPNGDILVATAWHTAEWAAQAPSKKGEKFYLVQGYETWAGPAERVEATYRLPLRKVVVSSWLKRILENRFGQRVLGPIVPGVRQEQFFNDAKVDHDPCRVGMLFHRLECKGMEDGLEALACLARQGISFELVTFGRIGLSPGQSIVFPCPTHVFNDPPQDSLRAIYSMCDIWLCPSRGEGGPPLTSMEACACRCALVTTDIGAVSDVFEHSATALVSPPREPARLAAHCALLIRDVTKRRQLAEAGYSRVRQFTWRRFATQMLAAFGS